MKQSKTVIDLLRTGKRLRCLVEWHGYSIRDIQFYLGLSYPQSIYRWFNGEALPSVDHLLRLSELFHMHMEDLLVSNSSRHEDLHTIRYMRDVNLEKRIMAYMDRLLAKSAVC